MKSLLGLVSLLLSLQAIGAQAQIMDATAYEGSVAIAVTPATTAPFATAVIADTHLLYAPWSEWGHDALYHISDKGLAWAQDIIDGKLQAPRRLTGPAVPAGKFYSVYNATLYVVSAKNELWAIPIESETVGNTKISTGLGDPIKLDGVVGMKGLVVKSAWVERGFLYLLGDKQDIAVQAVADELGSALLLKSPTAAVVAKEGPLKLLGLRWGFMDSGNYYFAFNIITTKGEVWGQYRQPDSFDDGGQSGGALGSDNLALLNAKGTRILGLWQDGVRFVTPAGQLWAIPISFP